MKNSHLVYISLGSNIEPEHNMRAALAYLKDKLSIKAVSLFYQSAAISRPNDPLFYNAVLQCTTSRSAADVGSVILKPMEEHLGRVRTQDKYAPRTMDADLILYDQLVCDLPGLVLPDPDIRTRPFLVCALCELDPELCLPDTAESIAAVCRKLNSNAMIRLDHFTNQIRQEFNL